MHATKWLFVVHFRRGSRILKGSNVGMRPAMPRSDAVSAGMCIAACKRDYVLWSDAAGRAGSAQASKDCTSPAQKAESVAD